MNFTPPDIIICLILVFFTFNGFRHGFIEEVTKLISLIGGFIFASKIHHLFVPFIDPYIKSNTIQVTLAYMGIFIIVVIMINMVGKIIQKFIEFVLLGWLNRILGMLIGLLKGFLIISIIIFIIDALPINIDKNNTIKQRLVTESVMYQICENVRELAILTMPIENNFNSFEKIIRDDLKEEKIQQYLK